MILIEPVTSNISYCGVTEYIFAAVIRLHEFSIDDFLFIEKIFREIHKGKNMDQILKELEVMTIYWDADKKVVFAKWKKPGTIEQQKEATDLALDAMKAYNVKELLFDPTELGMFRVDFKNWLDTDWFPRALGLGLNKIANILPKSELAKMSLDQVLTKVDNFQSKYFDNVAEAKTWLKS